MNQSFHLKIRPLKRNRESRQGEAVAKSHFHDALPRGCTIFINQLLKQLNALAYMLLLLL